MPYLIEILLFLAPFAAYALWRRFNPSDEPSDVVLLLAAVGVVLMVAGGLLYGLSHSMGREDAYVPPRMEDGRIVPAHPERR